MNTIWGILAWFTAGFIVFVAVLLIWVWIESTIATKRLRKLHEQAEKKRIHGGGSHWIENDYPGRARVRQHRRAAMLSDNLL